jgi:energy-coupling factor transporter ATP-binding protein EcfA2
MTRTQSAIKLTTLEITNFRAFPQPYKFDFDDKNVVIYGENGSGKSSVFRAIEYFFMASEEASADITKHANIFMPDTQEIANIFMPDTQEIAKDLVEISLTFSHPLQNKSTARKFVWNNEGSSPNEPEIREINNALSLLDYHKLLQLHNVRSGNVQNQIDLWPLLQHTILYRIINPETQQTFQADYNQITELLNTTRRTKAQNLALESIIQSYELGFITALKNLTSIANQLLMYFFPITDETQQSNTRIEFLLDDFHMPIPDRTTKTQAYAPQLFMRAYYYGKQINQFSTFLNEARLSAIAISLYLAAIKLTPPANVRLLVLDDVLLGIDLPNRLMILDILKAKFDDWQIILLTHDHIWFTMIRDNLPRCKFLELYQNESFGIPTPILKPFTKSLDRAKEYLQSKDYAAAGFYARNALEEYVKKWVNNRQLEIKIKARSGQIFIDLDVYIIAMEKYIKNNSSIPNKEAILDHLIIVKHFKDTILNKLVHNTERSAFPNEIKGAINSIVELERLLPRTPVQPLNSAISQPNN